MNADDRDLILKLLRALEQMCFERSILESLLVGAKVPGWRTTYEQMLADNSIRQPFHEQFRPAFEQLQREASAGQAIRELLRSLPKRGKPN
jgi:hypothetical protein